LELVEEMASLRKKKTFGAKTKSKGAAASEATGVKVPPTATRATAGRITAKTKEAKKETKASSAPAPTTKAKGKKRIDSATAAAAAGGGGERRVDGADSRRSSASDATVTLETGGEGRLRRILEEEVVKRLAVEEALVRLQHENDLLKQGSGLPQRGERASEGLCAGEREG
jgi:hypothetical protein